MIGRWPRLLLLLLSVCNTHIFFLSKVLSFAFALLTFFSLSLLLFVGVFDGGFSHLILPLLRHICFYNLFLPLMLPTTRDVHSTKESFSLLEVSSVTSVPPRSQSSLYGKREKRDHNIFIQKPSNRESFSTKNGLFFAPKKREKQLRK